jgi:hypothetical protein
MPIRDFSDEELGFLYRLPNGTLRGLKSKGCDPTDARSVVAAIRKSTRKPDEWREFFEGEDETSHEYWKKEETREKVKKLQLSNSLAEGEQYKREDVDAAKMALGSAFKLSLMEAKATLPPQLTGLTEAEIEKVLDDVFRNTLQNMSDLQSQLWTQIRDKYARSDDNGPDTEQGGSGDAAKPGSNRKPVVPRKRKAGAGSGPES